MENIKPEISIKYISDGIIREFSFKFEIFDSNNIDVYIDDKKQFSGYYVKRNMEGAGGGQVIFYEAPEKGKQITIIRQMPLVRITDFKEGGPFRASKINLEFDYQLACLEQIAENINRTILKPPYLSDVDLSLPSPQAGKTIVWNNDGTGLKNSDISLDLISNFYNEACELYNTCTTNLEDITKKINDLNHFINCIDEINEKFDNVYDNIDQKANTDFSNTDVFDYIVEEWTSADNKNWYIKYKSGLIEQGGYIDNGFTAIFPKPFAKVCYSANVTCVSSGAQGYVMYLSDLPSLTTLTAKRNSGTALPFTWHALGR